MDAEARRAARTDWPVRRFASFEAADAADRQYYSALTPAERIEMVWPITCDAWAVMGKGDAERRLQRHAVRVRRRGR